MTELVGAPRIGVCGVCVALGVALSLTACGADPNIDTDELTAWGGAPQGGGATSPNGDGANVMAGSAAGGQAGAPDESGGPGGASSGPDGSGGQGVAGIGSDGGATAEPGTAGTASEGGAGPEAAGAGSDVGGAGAETAGAGNDMMPPDDSSATPDPLRAEAQCTSGQFNNDRESPRMRPGEACIACHSRGEGPRFSIAGTLFPTGHEPNDCVGAGPDSGATIVITDANGMELTLMPNTSGNFFANGPIAMPYTAKVVTAEGERPMYSPQTDGDCNSCHTADGDTGAPGRIVLPAP